MVESKGSFLNPPKDARPMVRWWWPGTDVRKNELLKELAELDEKGFSGAEIQAFVMGMPPNLQKEDSARYERCHRFMQPYYYEMIAAVLDEAEKREMTIDVAVSSGWPTGGTHVKKEESMQVIVSAHRAVKGNKRYRGTVPKVKKTPFYRINEALKAFQSDYVDYYPDDLKLRYVVAARPYSKLGWKKLFKTDTILLEHESVIDLTGQFDENGILDWDVPEGRWHIFAFYSGSSGSEPLFSAKADPEKESMIVDHFSSDSVLNNLKLHIGRGTVYFGDHFGRTLRGFFTENSKNVMKGMWSDNFIREFKERRGYDLTPFLPLLLGPINYNDNVHVLTETETPWFDIEEDEIGDRIRYDYELTFSDLFSEKFVGTMADWGKENRLKCRIQAYGMRVDVLKAYGLSDIPETEQFYAGGIMDFLKLAGSAGIIYNKPIVTAEAMAWNRRDYKTTPMKWKVSADRLFTAGINQLIYHGFPYQDRHADCPESYPFSSPHTPESLSSSTNFSRINEFWDFFPELNMYVTRCQYILQQGETACNVGVYYPAFNCRDTVIKQEELTGGVLDENDAPIDSSTMGGTQKNQLNTEEEWLKSHIELGDNLTANGYYYTHINEECILDGRAEMGKLLAGSAELEVIIFNGIKYITLVLAKKLKQLSDAGIRIIFIGGLPEKQPGYHNFRANDLIIKDLIREINETQKAFISGEDPVPFLKVKGILPDVVFEREEKHIYYIHKKTGDSDFYFIRSSKNHSTRIKLSFPHRYRTPFILDPWTGHSNEATVYETVGNYVMIELDFDPYGSCVIEFKNVNAIKRSVVSGDIKVVREDNRLIAYTDTQGEFSFKLETGELKKIKVSSLLPDPLELKIWNFHTVYKEHAGEIQTIRMKMNGLRDWRLISDLRYCSGRGSYITEFTLDERWFHGSINITLSLGQVGDVALVKCNDTELKPRLIQPYNFDITPYLNSGENILEVTVVPTLNNQLIGYAHQGAAAYKNHKTKKSLMPSGLIGPVKIIPMFKIVVI